jgi:hypothetical protein
MKLPDVVSLVLCDRLGVDLATGQVSLVGIFHHLSFRTFPSPFEKFTVWGTLYDGVGEGTIQLLINRLETESVIYTFTRWTAFPGRQLFVNVEIPIKRCAFPAPGRYELILRFDNKDLTRRYLDVHRI